MLKNTLALLVINITFIAHCQIGFQNHNIISNIGASAKNGIAKDVNSDGFIDLVVFSDSELSWLKNLDGQGNFSNPILIENGNFISADLVDIDGDGFKDIIYGKTSNNSNQISWKKNSDGQGTFAAATPLTTTGFFAKIQIIDIESDGDFDITYLSTSGVITLKNNGNAVFTSQTIVSSSSILDFLLTDVDGDQRQDIIIRSTSTALNYYQQNSNGLFVFKETMDSFVNNNYDKSFIVSGDIDADGDNDVAVIHENGSDKRIKWYKNTNNVFANNLTLMQMPNDNGIASNEKRSIILKDLDNDGLLDVVMQNMFLNRVSWFKNLGTTLGMGSEQIICNTCVGNHSITMGDINNNGKLDVVVFGSLSNSIIWYDNTNGLGNSFVSNEISQFVISPSKIAVGDIDGDGKKDVLVTSTNDHKLSWYRNTNGLGDFSENQRIITSTLINAQNGLLVDMNNDGKNDIIALSSPYETSQAPKLVQYINTGNGQFSTEQVLYSVANDNISKIEAIDIDNDGDLDIVASSGLGDMKVFKNNGYATYSTPSSFAQSAGFFVPSDVDNDGDVDLVVASTTEFFWLENTNGQGNFSTKTVIPTNLSLPRKFVIGDINNDGLKEVVYTNSNLGRITINANGTFGTQTTITSLGNSNVIDIADLDNDGDLDIVCSAATSSGSTNRFRYYQNLGNSIFGPATQINFDNINDIPYVNGFSSIAIDDINGDGKKDVFLSVTYYTKVMWFENKGALLNTINGKITLDVANNGCASSSNAAQEILVSTSEGNFTQSTFTNATGNYSFQVGEGNYTTTISTPIPNFPSNPASFTNALSGLNTSITADFCLEPSIFYDDLAVTFYPINNARPGFESKYIMVVKNKGTNTVSSSVTLNYNNLKLDFLNANKPIINQTTNSMEFSVPNLQPFEQFQTELTFEVKQIPSVSLGEQIEFITTNTLSTDATPNNNSFTYHQIIVGSYDPNDIQVLEGEEVLISDSDKYLHYIIRFQNTGNFYAERVQITAPLDNKLDWKTMELEAYSHANKSQITNENLITFTFDAIYLPSQQTNEEDSNGFIAFKIKPKNTISVGDIVQEQANIYFDFNPPIITNQVYTEYVTMLNTADFETEKIVAYPNPVTKKLFLSTSNKPYNASLYNVLGQMVLTVNSEPYIDFTSLMPGIYFLKIALNEKDIQTIRIIKQ